MQVVFANPRGFCAGVERAIDIVHWAINYYGPPIYALHELVHNKHVVDDLRARGVVFVDYLSEVPDGGILIFSAHGVSPAIQSEAAVRGLQVINGTCPLVSKVHNEVLEHSRAGRTVFLIGHNDHVEVQGTLGHYGGKGDIHVIENEHDAQRVNVEPGRPVAYVTQTTLSVTDSARIVEILRSRFPGLSGPATDDICYATQNRQRAVLELARCCDVVVVIGARHSSNSLRLREVAEEQGVPAYLVESSAHIDYEWFDGVGVIGVTSGASVPEVLVNEVLRKFRHWWPDLEEITIGEPEIVHFRLPKRMGGLSSLPESKLKEIGMTPSLGECCD